MERSVCVPKPRRQCVASGLKKGQHSWHSVGDGTPQACVSAPKGESEISDSLRPEVGPEVRPYVNSILLYELRKGGEIYAICLYIITISAGMQRRMLTLPAY